MGVQGVEELWLTVFIKKKKKLTVTIQSAHLATSDTDLLTHLTSMCVLDSETPVIPDLSLHRK